MPRRRRATALALAALVLFSVSAAPVAAASTTIFFDNEGPEQGITVPGECCFSFAGAEFAGFEGVFTPADPALTASGDGVYRVVGSDIGLIVYLDPPADRVSFFFVHDVEENVLIGSAHMIDESGTEIAHVSSRPSTFAGDPANFFFVEGDEPIAEIRMFGLAAYLDDFTFETDAVAGAGSIPDGFVVPGEPLRLAKTGTGRISLSWGASCAPGDADYAVYEGLLGDFQSHVPSGGVACTTGGATGAELTPGFGHRFYLVVPQGSAAEGSYGVDGAGAPRARSASACLPQQLAGCVP